MNNMSSEYKTPVKFKYDVSYVYLAQSAPQTAPIILSCDLSHIMPKPPPHTGTIQHLICNISNDNVWHHGHSVNLHLYMYK